MMTTEPSATVPRLNVLLVDDHAVVREGYRRLLSDAPDLQVIGEAGSGAEACTLYAQLRPDLVVMDISLPDFSGIEALRRIRVQDPAARVLMFSMHDAPTFASRALAAGAGGFVTKASAPDVLVQALRRIAAGQRYLSHDVAQGVALAAVAPPRSGGRDAGAGPSGIEGLSGRELEVLRLLARGEPVQRVAELLGLTAKTVANYQSTIKHKLGADTPARLVHLAVRHGVLPPDDAG